MLKVTDVYLYYVNGRLISSEFIEECFEQHSILPPAVHISHDKAKGKGKQKVSSFTVIIAPFTSS